MVMKVPKSENVQLCRGDEVVISQLPSRVCPVKLLKNLSPNFKFLQIPGIWFLDPFLRLSVHIMVKCNVRIDLLQPNWQKAWELVWGCWPKWSVFIMVKCYVRIDVPQPNWYKAYDVSLFEGVGQYSLFIFIVKCNDRPVVPQPNWYQDWLLKRRSRLHI